eukprot:2606259-Amphidinium_carterae.1
MTLQSCGRKQMQRRSPREQCKTTWSQKGQREEREGGPRAVLQPGPPEKGEAAAAAVTDPMVVDDDEKKNPGI